MTRPRMARSVASWIELWMAMPAQEVDKPTIATAGIAIYIVPLAIATAIATAATIELPTAIR